MKIVNALKNIDGKLVIVGLGTLAVFGSFVVGVVLYAILQGLGINEDLAWGLAVLMWIAVVALGVFGVVSFYNSTKNRVEQVTVIREVTAPPARPELPVVETEPQTLRDKATPPAVPSSSYRSMLLEGNKDDDELR